MTATFTTAAVRADTVFPVNSLITAGVPVAGSSDAPVTHYAPLLASSRG